MRPRDRELVRHGIGPGPDFGTPNTADSSVAVEGNTNRDANGLIGCAENPSAISTCGLDGDTNGDFGAGGPGFFVGFCRAT